jgi:hypothetical protein
MAYAPSELVELIDPWRSAAPPHGQSPEPGSTLARAYQLRRRFQRSPGQADPTGTGNSLALSYGSLVLLLLGLWLHSGWLMALAALGLVVWRCFHAMLYMAAPQSRGRQWAQEYRAMYYELSMTPAPRLIAVHEEVRATKRAGATAISSLLGSDMLSLSDALLRAAELRDAELIGAEARTPWSALPGWWRALAGQQSPGPAFSWRTRARYCAAYDFFFQPQLAFQQALDQLDVDEQLLASSAVSNKVAVQD